MSSVVNFQFAAAILTDNCSILIAPAITEAIESGNLVKAHTRMFDVDKAFGGQFVQCAVEPSVCYAVLFFGFFVGKHDFSIVDYNRVTFA